MCKYRNKNKIIHLYVFIYNRTVDHYWSSYWFSNKQHYLSLSTSIYTRKHTYFSRIRIYIFNVNSNKRMNVFTNVNIYRYMNMRLEKFGDPGTKISHFEMLYVYHLSQHLAIAGEITQQEECFYDELAVLAFFTFTHCRTKFPRSLLLMFLNNCHGFGTNCIVPSEWDSAPICVCGPNFTSDLIENPRFHQRFSGYL